tara:strand:+ start:1459 stop:1776 length:318 start_codon:yes stop_codon:yes gene_type:complete
MAITKTIIVDKTEVVSCGSTYSSDEWKSIQVRTATVIKEDGVELSRSYHRHVLDPGTVAAGSTSLTDTNISSEDAGVQAICNAVWTDSVKEAWRLNLVGIRSESL